MNVHVTPGDWATLGAIAAFMRSGLMTAATDAEIADVSTFSVNTTRRAISKWESFGLIRREGHGAGRRIWIADQSLYSECLRLRAAGSKLAVTNCVQVARVLHQAASAQSGDSAGQLHDP